VAAARVQLSGCYLRYEVVGFKVVSATQLLYKVCGARKVVDGGGFEARRDAAFGMAENGVQSSGNLFYTGSYQSLYVLGQCEGSLGNEDCGGCIKSGAEQARDQCGDSISAQVYLQSCFLSYSFYPNGVPTASSSSSGEINHFKNENQLNNLTIETLLPYLNKYSSVQRSIMTNLLILAKLIWKFF